MRDENLTRSPCLHDLQTAESRYNFVQVLISCLFKCEEARKVDDAVRARDLHRAGALSQQHCCYLKGVRDPQEGPDAEENSERDRKQVLDRKKEKTRGRKKR